MNKTTYTLPFCGDEKEELLKILANYPKYTKRINESVGCWSSFDVTPFYNTKWKYKNHKGEIIEFDGPFYSTGIVQDLQSAIKSVKEGGYSQLSTIGYFYDENGMLNDASNIHNYIK